MFKKLVANLPFNPSLIAQVGFYADRLRQERSIRRVSFVFIALAMLVQMFAVVSPPEKSLAYSTNHIINGLRTKNDILAAYDNPNGDVRDIFTRFNLSRADIASLPDKPNVTIRSNDGSDWWTTGRSSLWGYSNVNEVYKRSQVPVQYRGANTPGAEDDSFVYARSLRAWDIRNPYNTYKAFKGKSSATGQEFWILIDCGNITWKGNWKTPTPTPTPEPEPKKPKLEVRKSIAKINGELKPGDTYTYRIEYRNSALESVAKDVYIEDQLDVKNFDVISPRNLALNNGYLRYPVGDLMGSANFKYLEITVRLKNPLPSPTEICNISSLTSSNASRVNSKQICTTVVTPCPFDESVENINNPNCVQKCSLVDAKINNATREVTFETKLKYNDPANTKVYSYTYDFGDGSKLVNKSTKLTDTALHTYKAGEFTAKVTVSYEKVSGGGKQEASCQAKLEFDDDQPLSESKTVANLTTGKFGDDAIKSAVKAGDELEYTLTTLNTQKHDRNGIVVSDYIGDILDYATLDIEALKADGGRFDKETKKVIWDDIKIPANSKVESKFKVKIMDPIPATNQPSGTTTDFDCKISNFYGNEITMDLQCPAVKGIETLPNTGPGTSLLIGTGLTALVGYFFARSRLLSKELEIIRTDYLTSGGM